jgi:predicted transcriptional regulator
MNKKVENAKVEKITDEQLQDLQGHVSKINQAQMELGRIESQKYELVNAIPQFKKNLKDFQDKMEDQYGKVSINIQDGSISEIDEQGNS